MITVADTLSLSGIKTPILTGMIKVGDIGSEDFTVGAAYMSATSVELQDLGNLGPSALNIDPSQVEPTPDTWVAFRVTSATIGRRYDPLLTGPNNTAGAPSANGVDYSMGDLPGGRAPFTQVTLPAFTLAAPTHSGLTVYVSGAAESSNSSAPSQTTEVDLYSHNTILADTELVAIPVTVPHPAGAWDGLLLPYAASYTLLIDFWNDVYGPQGNSGKVDPFIYQYIPDGDGFSSDQIQL